MIQITPQMEILVAVEPTDFRKGIDGLAQVCRAVLHANPLSGTLFVFRSRSAKAVRILVYDGQGFWLCHKRLSSGRFRHWPCHAGDTRATLLAHELQVLIAGGDPSCVQGAEVWRPIGIRSEQMS